MTSDEQKKNDRPASDPRGQDCLVELATALLQQSFRDLPEAARGVAINELCLLISQMRYRDSKYMELERRRWVERLAVRLCLQCPEMKGYQGEVQLELEKRVALAMLLYQDWREKFAPVFSERGTA